MVTGWKITPLTACDSALKAFTVCYEGWFCALTAEEVQKKKRMEVCKRKCNLISEFKPLRIAALNAVAAL